MSDERKLFPAAEAAARAARPEGDDLRSHLIKEYRTALQALFDAVMADEEHDPAGACPICAAMARAKEALRK